MRRQLEQQGYKLPRCQSQQQHPFEPQPQQRFSSGSFPVNSGHPELVEGASSFKRVLLPKRARDEAQKGKSANPRFAGRIFF